VAQALGLLDFTKDRLTIGCSYCLLVFFGLEGSQKPAYPKTPISPNDLSSNIACCTQPYPISGHLRRTRVVSLWFPCAKIAWQEYGFMVAIRGIGAQPGRSNGPEKQEQENAAIPENAAQQHPLAPNVQEACLMGLTAEELEESVKLDQGDIIRYLGLSNNQVFEWEIQNAEDHWHKHNIRFEEAITVFDDPNRISELDNRFNYGEERWRTIGMAGNLLLLVVAHTIRDDNDDIEIVRIISVRRAEHPERRYYDNRKF
jgi:uncharacterized DUF497 family protein